MSEEPAPYDAGGPRPERVVIQMTMYIECAPFDHFSADEIKRGINKNHRRIESKRCAIQRLIDEVKWFLRGHIPEGYAVSVTYGSKAWEAPDPPSSGV